jgi:hypothetical protein
LVNEIASIISQLERQRAAIDRAISALRDVEGVKQAQTASPGEATTKKPKKRRMSAAGRRRIAEAAKKRWADKRAAEGVTTEKPGPTKKRSLPKKGARKRAARKAATLPAV